MGDTLYMAFQNRIRQLESEAKEKDHRIATLVAEVKELQKEKQRLKKEK